jgi:hypothetical protein
MTRAFDDGVGEPTVSAEQTAELRGEALVIQMLLHQLCAQLTNFAAYPHDQLRRAALDLAAEHIRSAEKLLRALDDVLDPRLDPGGHDHYARHLQQRIDRERQALTEAG